MIRSPIAVRLTAASGVDIRDQMADVARLGAKGVVLEAADELAPHRLGETGRRDLRHALRTMQLELAAMVLPTRRPFDDAEALDDRLARAEKTFAYCYELGGRLVLARLGPAPSGAEADSGRREIFVDALRELGLRADRRGVRLAAELAGDPAGDLVNLLDGLELPSLAMSIDPAPALAQGRDPSAEVMASARWLAHVYAADPSGQGAPERGVLTPRSTGFRAGPLDWEAFLGSLEEVNYRGAVTIWPDMRRDAADQVRDVLAILKRY